MDKRLPLTAEEIKELKRIEKMSYDEMVDYFTKISLTESTCSQIKEIDMTLEEFQDTYDCVDMSQFLSSYGGRHFNCVKRSNNKSLTSYVI